MKIEIVGINTLNGIRLRKRILKIVNEIDEKIIINFVEDYESDNLPILYINSRLIIRGCVPTEREIVKYLKKAYKE